LLPYSILCLYSLLFTLYPPSPLFSFTSGFKKGFLSLKARLAPFLRLARVSDLWLSELGALSTRRDRWLAGRADNALSACLHGRFPSKFLLLANQVDVSLSRWYSLSAWSRLSETKVAASSKFSPFYLKLKWNLH